MIKKIISITIVWTMCLGNTVFAITNGPAGARKMLAPMVSIKAPVFQEGYIRAVNTAEETLPTSEFGKKMQKMISSSPRLRNTKLIKEFFAGFQNAVNKFLEGEGYAALYAAALKSTDSLKIYNNADVRALPETAVKFWRESAALFEKIDIEAVRKKVPAAQNKIIYLFLAAKAEALFTLAEKDSALSDLQKLQNYSRVKDLLEEAFSLPQTKEDFSSLDRMGTSCAKLATDSRISLKQKLALAEESLSYFASAAKIAKNMPDNALSRILKEDMYYTYFTVSYFAGDVCIEMENYEQAIEFYERTAGLVKGFSSRPEAQAGIKGFYHNFYRLLWKSGDKLYIQGLKGTEEESAQADLYYKKAEKISREFSAMLSPSEAQSEAGYDVFVCIAEINANMAENAIKRHDFAAAYEHLEKATAEIKRMNALPAFGQADNFLYAKMNILLVSRYLDLINVFLKQNGADKKQLKELSGFFDRDFFAGFMKRFDSGVFAPVFRRMAEGKDEDAEEFICRELFRGSQTNEAVRRRLVAVVNFNPRREDKNAARQFNKSYGFLARVTLAIAYLHEDNYALAKQTLIESGSFYDKFLQSSAIAETILPLAAMAGKPGQEFLGELFQSRVGMMLRNNIIAHKDILSPQSIKLLEGIFSEPENARLLKDNKSLLEALDITIKAPAPKPAAVPAKPKLNLAGIKVVKTADVLIAGMNRALTAVKENMNGKAKRIKKKGKKQQKKQKGFDATSPQIGQLRNTLKEMTESYEERGSSEVLNYLKTLAQKEKEIFANKFARRVILEGLAGMENKEAVEILNGYREACRQDQAAAADTAAAYEKAKNYFDTLNNLSARAEALKEEIAGIELNGVSSAEAEQELNGLEAQAQSLLGDYSGVKERPLGEKAFEKYSGELEQALSAARTKVEAFKESRKDAFLDEAANCKNEIEQKWAENTKEGLSGAQIVGALLSWQKEQKLPQPDRDIAQEPAVQQAQENLAAFWQEKQDQIREEIKKHSLLAKGKIRFEFSPDMKKLHFDNLDILLGINRQAVVKEMFDVIQVFLKYNPQADVATAITGRENENSSGFFLPLLDQAKEKLAVEFSRQADEFMKKYEQGMQSLLEPGVPELARIKGVQDLLGENFDHPQFVNKFDPDFKDASGIMQSALDYFSARSQSLWKKQEEIQTICLGTFKLEVEGNYRYLYFEPQTDLIDMKQAAPELHRIWAEALSYNPDVEMKVPAGMANADWVGKMQDIWDEEYQNMIDRKQQETVVREKPEVDTGLSASEAVITRAI